MAEVAEYVPYDRQVEHLTEREALDRYQADRQLHPDAIVSLEDLDCGHWQVKTYKTEADKTAHVQNYAQKMIRQFFKMLILEK